MAMDLSAYKDGMKPFDGHFWVEKDGEIIDRHFSGYDFIKKVQGCEGEMQYCPAPPLIQAVMIGLAKKTLKTNLKIDAMREGIIRTDIYDKEINKDIDVDKALDKKINKLREGQCHITAIALQKKYGGNIVFGSMGWKKKKSDDIHWEFGGADWTTVAQFQCK
jgi:hypothetical protein